MSERSLSTLLHDAIPEPEPLDVEGVRTRAARRRRNRRAVVGVVCALVLAAGAGSWGLLSDGTQRLKVTPARPNQPEVFEEVPLDATAVATGADGSLWALVDRGDAFEVDELDPATGQVTRKLGGDGPATRLAVGAGAVWVGGGGDGAEPDGQLKVFDAARGDLVDTQRIPRGGPASFSIDGGTVWMTTGAAGELWRMAYDGKSVSHQPVAIGGQADNFVVLSSGTLWVHDQVGHRIVPVDKRTLAVGGAVRWQGSPLVASGATTAWGYDATGEMVEMDLSSFGPDGPAVVQRIPTEQRYAAVATAPGAVWLYRNGVERWRLPLNGGSHDVKAADKQVHFLTTVAGSAWFTTAQRQLFHWRPAGEAAGTNDPPAVASSRAGHLIVFVDNESTDDQIAAVRDALRADPAMTDVEFFDHAAAYAEFKEMFKNQPDLVAKTKPETLPRSVRALPKDSAAAIVAARHIRGLAGVKEILCPDGSRCPS